MARKDNSEKVTGTEEYFKFMRRLFKAYARKAYAGTVDVTALEQLTEIRRELDDQTAEVVRGLRSQPEAPSWAEIGAALGITRAAAFKRYGTTADQYGEGRTPMDAAAETRKVGGQPSHLR